jgi:hypothetical protein
MSFTSLTFLLALGLFLGNLVLMEVGRRIALRRLANDPDGALAGIGAIDGAVFALLGLLVAFTFQGAASRFDTRRQLIVEETNAIGTAYLRIDLVPPEAQPALRDSFRRYVDSRIELYRDVSDPEVNRENFARTKQLQGEIWRQAVAAGKMEGAPTSTTILLAPALNHMIDITTTRIKATQMHPPKIIFVMLVALALACALFAGFDMAARKSRSWLHMLGLASVMATSLYVILDLEYPRRGLIRLDTFDRTLVELREDMK